MTTSKYITLVGYPNSGKTTLFNQLTNNHNKIVNYPGSTVDYAIGNLDKTIKVIDTPGIVSLVPKTIDEEVAISTLDKMHCLFASSKKSPELVLFVLDCTQLNRQLVLLKQLAELNYNIIVVLNRGKEAIKSGVDIDVEALSKAINLPVYVNLDRLHDLISLCKQHIDLDNDTEQIPKEIKEKEIERLFEWSSKIEELSIKVNKTAKQWDLDTLFLHRYMGPVVFFGTMILLFWSIFYLSGPFMDGIDSGIGWLIQAVHTFFPKSWVTTLLADGIIAGFGAIVIFAPQILILFIWIGILEQSGFLARGAVMVDRPLSMVGLNGRSFVPLLSGCACSIPAMMAARTIPGKKQRFLTQFVIPLMTCSARLPVYGLLLAILFPKQPFISGIAMTGIYCLSIALASIVAAIGARLIRLDDTDQFHMELPDWKRPQFKQVLISAALQTKSFITNAGPIILVVGILLWVLSTYPTAESSYAMIVGSWLEPLFRPMGIDWRVVVGLLLAFAAREVFVSALVLVFAVQQEKIEGLSNVLSQATFMETGEKIFTTSTVCGLIVFFMVAMQCMSTMAVAKKEMESLKASLMMTGTYIVMAYILSVIVVQGLRLCGVS